MSALPLHRLSRAEALSAADRPAPAFRRRFHFSRSWRDLSYDNVALYPRPVPTSVLHELLATLAQIQLKLNATTPSKTLRTQIVNLIETARRILHDKCYDNIEFLITGNIPASFILFAQFLITYGNRIPWEECVVRYQDLFKKARELSSEPNASVQESTWRTRRMQSAASSGGVSRDHFLEEL